MISRLAILIMLFTSGCDIISSDKDITSKSDSPQTTFKSLKFKEISSPENY